jgi:photosystem II stability/assembly factor-like uncharacterized protein
MLAITLATERGLRVVGSPSDPLTGADVTTLAIGRACLWALVESRKVFRIARGQAEHVTTLDGPRGMCLTEYSGTLFVGTEQAGLFKLDGSTLKRVAGFDAAPGHDEWWQPPGHRPATTWTMDSASGQLYVNVHVGGILRSRDGGESFTATIDLDDDVHEVRLSSDGRVWAATGKKGLAESRDSGENWSYHTAGLHAEYLTCLAPLEDGLLVGASSDFGTGDDAIYRFDGRKFTRCTYGLPEAVGGGLSARRMAAHQRHAAVVNGDKLYASDDAGHSWRVAAEDLPSVRAVVIA